jgi:hypothetical protein
MYVLFFTKDNNYWYTFVEGSVDFLRLILISLMGKGIVRKDILREKLKNKS